MLDHNQPTADDHPMPVILTASGLSVGYNTPNGPSVVVHDVDLNLHKGKVTTLIGESGSGKTTVARALIALLPRGAFVSSGSIGFQAASGTDHQLVGASSESIRHLRWNEMAYIPQAAASSFNPLLTVAQHFEETADSHGFKWRDHLDRASDLLRTVRVDPGRILNSYPHELSGGTAQRAFIALALFLDPSIIVLDEPTTGLDVITQRSVVETLKDLQQRLESAFLLVTHDLSLAIEMGGEVNTMYAGRIVERWQPESQSEPQHPYTTALLHAAPTTQHDITPKEIPGRPANPARPPAGCAFHPRCSRAYEACDSGAPPSLISIGRSQVACHLFDGEQDD